MYDFGHGVVRDNAKAFEQYQRRTDVENMDAACNLGRMYEDGYGVEKDSSNALSVFTSMPQIAGTRTPPAAWELCTNVEMAW